MEMWLPLGVIGFASQPDPEITGICRDNGAIVAVVHGDNGLVAPMPGMDVDMPYVGGWAAVRMEADDVGWHSVPPSVRTVIPAGSVRREAGSRDLISGKEARRNWLLRVPHTVIARSLEDSFHFSETCLRDFTGDPTEEIVRRHRILKEAYCRSGAIGTLDGWCSEKLAEITGECVPWGYPRSPEGGDALDLMRQRLRELESAKSSDA